MITLQHMLTLSGILFALSFAGIFLNRKNVILLLMCIELMLLAVNFNFVAFSRFLGDLDGQVFVFFVLTVAAAESAIGLAILVVLFRNVGIEPTEKKLVVVKSTNHFMAAYGPIPRDYRKIPYTRITRPIWPLDAETSPGLIL